MKPLNSVLVAALFLIGMSAFGQQPSPPPGHVDPHHGQVGRGMPTVDDHVKMLAEKLNLTDDQQAKVKPILQSERDQMAELMKDDSLSPDARRDKARGIHDQTHAKISELLNDDQKKKFDELQMEMRQRMRQDRPGGAENPPKSN